MKKILLIFVSLFLSACSSLQTNIIKKHSPHTPLPTTITQSISLFNAQKTKIGHAIRLEKNLYLTPDHLFEKNYKKIFYKNNQEKFSEIEVKMRDFSHDLLFFSLPQKPQKNIFPAIFTQREKQAKTQKAHQKNVPNIFYLSNFSTDKKNHIKSTKILTQISNIDIEHLSLKNLKTIPQQFPKGQSGLPFSDIHGNISGILIASHQSKQKSYILPSHQIQKVYRDGYLYSTN